MIVFVVVVFVAAVIVIVVVAIIPIWPRRIFASAAAIAACLHLRIAGCCLLVDCC